MIRRYLCTSCGEVVRAQAFDHGHDDGVYPNIFSVGCECITIDSCPYEMTQAETPDSWMVGREDCCTGVDATDLETVYGGGVADFRCPECGATYRWDGQMVDFPTKENTPKLDDSQGTLVAVRGGEDDE